MHLLTESPLGANAEAIAAVLRTLTPRPEALMTIASIAPLWIFGPQASKRFP
jgi:hypothetical protein